MTQFCAFDVETRGADAVFRSGALYWDGDGMFYEDPHAMIGQMRQLARAGYTFAAHYAEYDSTVLLWRHGEDLTLHYLNNLYSCGYWKFGRSRRNAQLWDTFKLAAGLSLADLGEAIGCPKYETPKRLLDPDDWRPDWVCETHGTPGCIICYNLRDAEIVWRYVTLLQEWIETHGVEMKRSLPGMAVALWQSWDLDKSQTLHSAQVRKLARTAYHAGRCEVFRYGVQHDVRVYDFRSHYGAIMAGAELPDCRQLTYSPQLPRSWDPDGKHGVVEAEVRVPALRCPPLPVVHGERVYYPTGRFRGAWAISELRRAIAAGVSVSWWGTAAWSPATVQPFTVTAPALLEAREQYRRQGSPLEVVPKLLLNSIPGRLGLREVQLRRIYRRWHAGVSLDELQGAELEAAGDAVYMVREHEVHRAPAASNPLWAAEITALGRIRLLDQLQRADRELVYCDTDSVHTLGTLDAGADRPGQLVLKDEYQVGRYLAPKLYRLESYTGNVEVKARGIPRRVAREFFERGSAHYQTSLGIVEALQRGVAPGTWVDVDRVRGLQLAARIPLNPRALAEPDQSSDTVPVAFEQDPDGGLTPRD